MKLNFDSFLCTRCNRPLARPSGHLHSVPPELPAQAKLTRCERVVYLLLCNGLTNKQIANQLVISENTVRFHLKKMYAKLGVRSRVHAVAVGSGAPLEAAPA